jgi:NADP-dependent 3-hydroxy acid dehydrogenase YdfG
MELKDLVAVVTGAGRGIGKVIAGKYFEEGTFVALWGRNKEQLKQVTTDLDPSGEKVIFDKVDVSNELEVQNGVSKVLGKFGKIDILVNNAGANYRTHQSKRWASICLNPSSK